jgi:hypothetical protein
MLNSLIGIIASSGGAAAAANDYESIATVTVGSGGSSSVSFTSIPSTYQHLQVRVLAKQTGTGTDQPLLFRVNSATGSYAVHNLRGNGSSALALGSINEADIFYQTQMATGSMASEIYSAFIIDLLDYSNTNKFKTIRGLGGFDANGSGTIALNSSLYQSTSAISTITFAPNSGNLSQFSSFALYGIKG